MYSLKQDYLVKNKLSPAIIKNKREVTEYRKIELLFYRIFFYTGFITLITACTALTIKIICDHVYTVNNPYRTGYDSMLKLRPGLSIVPIIDFKSTLIHFNPSREYTYRAYLDAMAAFTRRYDHPNLRENPMGDCTNTTLLKEDTSCLYNLDWAMDCNMLQDYGFSGGSPCIILKLNRVYGWIPDVEPGVDGINFECQGTTPFDSSLIKKITYFDTRREEISDRGLIPHYFFPYLGQENYHSPLVFVKFYYPRKNVVIRITCRAWAKNLDSHASFEMILD